jgi:hypothetical protein
MEEKRNNPDYAAIIREYRLYGGSGSGYAGCGELFIKALKYAWREWSAMEMVLENGGLELSNNLAEQMMRHFKRTLKNCLNIGSERSAKNVAFMFSVVESCYRAWI